MLRPFPLPVASVRSTARLLAVFGLLPAFAAHAQTWTNGGSGNWFAAGNWSGSAVPVAPISATIDNGGTAVISSGAAQPSRLNVGWFGTGSLQLLGGASLTTGNALIGGKANTTGTITVDGAGTQWTSASTSMVEIGGAGTGSLTISGGAHVASDLSLIGSLAGSQGSVTVTGSGSQWTHAGSFGILEVGSGSGGYGTLTISDAGQVGNVALRIGDEAGANGTVVVSGTGSTLINSSSLTIGVFGTGSLMIENGASVSNTYATLASTAGSSGTATVTGAGSVWTNTGDLRVGNAAASTLTISAGGKVTSVTGYVGDHSAVTATSTATVTGAGSQWTNSGELYVGSWGNGALSIAAGASVSNTDGIVGFKPGKTGSVTVSGANSKWTNSGSLRLGYNGAGTLAIVDGGNVTVGTAGTGTVTLGTLAGSTGALLIGQGGAPGTLSAGTVSSSYDTATITFNHNAGSYTFAPKITGLVNLAFTGPGTTTLSAASTFSGATRLDAGTLVLGHRLALQNSTVTYHGGTLSFGAFTTATLGALAGSRNLALGGTTLTVGNNNASTTYSGALSGTGGLTKAGSGTFTLSGAATFSGGTVVSAGTLRIGAANVLSATSALFVINGTTVNLAGYDQTVGDLDSYDSSAGTFDTGTLQLGGATLTTRTRVTNNWVGAITGTGYVVKQGAAVALWSGANTFSGTLTIAAGTLSAAAAGTLSPNAVVAIDSGATLNLASFRQTIAGLSGGGTVTLGSATLTLQPAAETTFSGAISGTGALVKNGAGALTLSGANTYTGATTITAGTLFVNGSLANTAVTIASEATLGGSGRIGGLTTIQGGAHLAPGNSPGTLTFTNGLTLAAGSILDFELGSTSDKIIVAGGTLTGPASGTITLNFTDAGGFAAGTYTLFDFSTGGTTTNSFDLADFALGSTITGFNYQLAQVGSTLQLTASAVPEPSTYALLLGAAALLVVGRNRWRRPIVN